MRRAPLGRWDLMVLRVSEVTEVCEEHKDFVERLVILVLVDLVVTRASKVHVEF